MPVFTKSLFLRDSSSHQNETYNFETLSQNAGSWDNVSISNTSLAAVAVLVAILTLFKTWKVWKIFRGRRLKNKIKLENLDNERSSLGCPLQVLHNCHYNENGVRNIQNIYYDYRTTVQNFVAYRERNPQIV
ncbi:uncharacterized protein H6S33_010610 [Morchella sextelata]|uniref:uncharacterized protein n=1 Tax=Morchella sextelata TaxID=1174677 RepID=UPI001D037813|nr:uncharacterized protein H6S33_010610 [Morchella sextelata]KAH0611345.1 hypothetical protein H6S33_010610 [Morchella sextelata]